MIAVMGGSEVLGQAAVPEPRLESWPTVTNAQQARAG